MKIYKNKSGHLTIIYGKDEKQPGVTLVHDRGVGNLTNMFGGKIDRYYYHSTNVSGNTPYSTMTDNSLLGEDDKRYKLVRSKQK